MSGSSSGALQAPYVSGSVQDRELLKAAFFPKDYLFLLSSIFAEKQSIMIMDTARHRKDMRIMVCIKAQLCLVTCVKIVRNVLKLY